MGYDVFQSGGNIIDAQSNKQSRPGIIEVATAAQVSTATVDRVINKRGGVREPTAIRVLQAAEQLGYVPQTPLSTGLQTKQHKLIFLLPAGTNPYLHQLSALIRSAHSAPSPFNVRCECHLVKSFDPAALANAIRYHGPKSDGLALMGLEHPVVREAINEVSKKGTPVVTIISEVSRCERVHFLGLDNRAVGRTAAYMLTRFCKQQEGEIAMIAGSLSYLAHNEREMGFLSFIQESFPGLRVVGAREGHDDFEENYQLTQLLLEQHPDLVGIYNIGGSSGGVAKALRKAGKAESIVFIGHGLTDDTRALLIDGTMDMIISQDPVNIVRNVCHVLSNIHNGFAPSECMLDITMGLICRENLP